MKTIQLTFLFEDTGFCKDVFQSVNQPYYYKASAQKRCNGVSNARLTELHMARYIYRAYQPFLPLKDQYGL